MSWCAFDQRIVIGHARLLRCLRNIVDIGAEGDHRLALSPACDERGRYSGNTSFDTESFLFQDSGQVFGRLEFLEAQLAEAEDAIHHHLRLLLHAVDLALQIGLQRGGSFWRNFRLAEAGYACQDRAKQNFLDHRNSFQRRSTACSKQCSEYSTLTA